METQSRSLNTKQKSMLQVTTNLGSKLYVVAIQNIEYDKLQVEFRLVRTHVIVATA